MMEDTTLGEILVSLGVITNEERFAAMECQRSAKGLHTYGEVLVKCGYASQEDVEDALRLQAKLRSKTPAERAAATFDVAKRSKEALGKTRRRLIATGHAIIEKAGTVDIPTPILGVPIFEDH